MRDCRAFVIAAALVTGWSCSGNEPAPTDSPAHDAGLRDVTPDPVPSDCCRDADADAHSSADAAPDVGDSGGTERLRVFLFSKTTGFRHDAIPAAVAALQNTGRERGWTVEAGEGAGQFTNASLSAFDVVVFLLTSGDVLDEAQQAAFQRFIQIGGGWVGIHSASDTEYDWPWYGELVGAYFLSHPPIQPAALRVERPSHLATQSLPNPWRRTDEWYAFRANPRSSVHVLLSLDEQSYSPETSAMGDHPIAWYHGYDGGRAFYTALGHTVESWSEPEFLEHVAGAIEWAAGREAEGVALVEFDEASPNGAWEIHQPSGSFNFQVDRTRLELQDFGDNQHLTRAGLALDPGRPYVVEGLFRLDEAPNGIDSFCFNLNVAGREGDYSSLSTWSINVDAAGGPPNGVMRHMGFAGGFRELGFEPAPWADGLIEYLLRVGVNQTKDGNFAPKIVTASVFQAGVQLEHFEVDYSPFPYQPNLDERVRFGVNAHGSDWTLRSLRIYYTD